MVGQDGAQGVVVVARREACDGVDQLALQRLQLPRLLDELLARGELGLDAPVPLEERDVHADEREHEHAADRDPGLPAGEPAAPGHRGMLPSGGRTSPFRIRA